MQINTSIKQKTIKNYQYSNIKSSIIPKTILIILIKN